MLTGDKRETAVNIARSASLCTSSTTLLLLSASSYDETYAQLGILINNARMLNKANTEFALVIDGSVSFASLGTFTNISSANSFQELLC